jgi:hypothetical protein
MQFLEKMFSIRANKTVYDTFEKDEGITLSSLSEAIRKYSQLLAHSQIVTGATGAHYYFNIEDDSNIIKLLGNELLAPAINIGEITDCVPKTLGLEIKVPAIQKYLYEDNEEENILKNILYKPMVKCIEKCVIGGTYFDKPLFSTTNTITGTKDFDGLLKLARAIKDKTDNACIVGNTKTISDIIDTITNQSYLTEYLLNSTIEGVPVIATVEAPESVDDKFLIGFDKIKLCLLLVPELKIRKFSLHTEAEDRFKIYSFVNGGDIFNTAIGIKE